MYKSRLSKPVRSTPPWPLLPVLEDFPSWWTMIRIHQLKQTLPSSSCFWSWGFRTLIETRWPELPCAELSHYSPNVPQLISVWLKTLVNLRTHGYTRCRVPEHGGVYYIWNLHLKSACLSTAVSGRVTEPGSTGETIPGPGTFLFSNFSCSITRQISYQNSISWAVFVLVQKRPQGKRLGIWF